MKEIKASKVIDFHKLTNLFQHVDRYGYMPGKDRHETVVEHSYSLALLAWYLVDAFELDFDKDKIIRYALAHDIPEVYAGDTYAFSDDEALLNSQDEREAKARENLKNEFPEALSIHETIDQYEMKDDPESVFVHALDKIHPVLREMLQEGRTIKEENLSYSRAVELKRRTTSASPEVSSLLEQLIDIIDQDKERYFGNNTD